MRRPPGWMFARSMGNVKFMVGVAVDSGRGCGGHSKADDVAIAARGQWFSNPAEWAIDCRDANSNSNYSMQVVIGWSLHSLSESEVYMRLMHAFCVKKTKVELEMFRAETHCVLPVRGK